MDIEIIKHCLSDVIEKGLMLDLDSAKEILDFINQQQETIDLNNERSKANSVKYKNKLKRYIKKKHKK